MYQNSKRTACVLSQTHTHRGSASDTHRDRRCHTQRDRTRPWSGACIQFTLVVFRVWPNVLPGDPCSVLLRLVLLYKYVHADLDDITTALTLQAHRHAHVRTTVRQRN